MPVNLYSVGLFVNNLNLMVAFYRDAVGMDIEWDGVDPHVLCVQGSVRFMLYGRRDFEEMTGRRYGYPSGVNGTFQLGIDLPCFSDVDREFDRLVELGALPVVPPQTYRWHAGAQRSCYVADPEGNLIELCSGGQDGRE